MNTLFEWGLIAEQAVRRATADTPTITAADTPAITTATLRPCHPCEIQPRQWAYGQFLLLAATAVLGAVDGGGKGSISVAIMLSMLTGRSLLGERVWRTGPVVVVSYEDDEIEWQRRIAAACIHYEIDPAEVFPHIHFVRKTNGRVSFAAPGDGGVTFPDGDRVVTLARGIGAVLILVDPFNHAHSLDDGNNNAMVAKVAGELSRVARNSGAAVLVLHHLRKGANGNPDDLMGATSLRATFRVCRILARMTPGEAKAMNLAEHWRYIRVAGSKENYAPPPERASWFKLVGVPLGNATSEYPNGDEIGVATTWLARGAFEGMDADRLSLVFTALRGTPHSPNRQAAKLPWAGKPLVDIGGRTSKEAITIIKRWLETGVLTKVDHTDEHRNKVQKLALDDTKAKAILEEIRGPEVSVE